MSQKDEVIARLTVSPGRRLLGVGALTALGCLLFYLAVTVPLTFIFQLFLLAMAAFALLGAWVMRAATAQEIELTETELRDSGGRMIAAIDDILSIDRGMFAFKPPNGFLLRLQSPKSRVWQPGLWWRIGSHVGIGGMTRAGQAKQIADLISIKLAQRPEAE